MDYYVAKNNERIGPLSLRDLQEFAKDGRIQPTTFVRMDGLWMRASNIQGVFSADEQGEVHPVQPPGGMSKTTRLYLAIITGLVLLLILLTVALILRGESVVIEKVNEPAVNRTVALPPPPPEAAAGTEEEPAFDGARYANSVEGLHHLMAEIIRHVELGDELMVKALFDSMLFPDPARNFRKLYRQELYERLMQDFPEDGGAAIVRSFESQVSRIVKDGYTDVIVYLKDDGKHRFYSASLGLPGTKRMINIRGFIYVDGGFRFQNFALLDELELELSRDKSSAEEL